MNAEWKIKTRLRRKGVVVITAPKFEERKLWWNWKGKES
jgi:hypothetical protein